MTSVRPPAVAGFFYPAQREELSRLLSSLLATAPGASRFPKAIIAPHAGYRYSGPIAASIYAPLAAARTRIRQVILLGPTHRVRMRGLALPDALSFETPLGT